MIKGGFYESLFLKTGFYSIVCTFAFRRQIPTPISLRLDRMRAAMELKIHREKNLGLRESLRADLKRMIYRKFKPYEYSVVCGCENQLINIDKQFLNLYSYIQYMLSVRCPVFIDTDYFDSSDVELIKMICESFGTDLFVQLDRNLIITDSLLNSVEKILSKGGVVCVTGVLEGPWGDSQISELFRRTFVAKMGKGFSCAALIIGQNTVLKYSLLRMLVSYRDSLDLRVVATMRGSGVDGFAPLGFELATADLVRV